MEKTVFNKTEKKQEVKVDKNSEFYTDPIRICKLKGHILKKPNPNSSFYENKDNRDLRKCSRCNNWVNIKNGA